MRTSRLLQLALVSASLVRVAVAGVDFHDHLGIQLWSLRDQMKADVPAALDWAKAHGFTAVETAGTGGLSDEAFLKLLDERGLKPVGAHVGYEALTKDLAAAVKSAKALGVKYVMTPWIPHTGAFTIAQAHEAAANFNRWGAAFRAEGIVYGYHPHGYEFAALTDGGGKRPFDILIEETKPENVSFEMDVFWVFHAGIDPAELLRKHGDRWVLMHVKDIRKGAVTGLSTGGAPPIDNVAVGAGQIDWVQVLKAARDVGVKYYFIEDETPTPLVCIPDSVKYLSALKL